jgi:transposase
MRAIHRYRGNLLQFAAQHQAALDQMNVRLHQVIADISGSTGLAIIEARLVGQRDPMQLAKLRDRRIKASEETVAKSLEGT